MKVLIEAPFTLKTNQEKAIEEQLQKLETYSNKITQADVFFKLGDGIAPDSVLAEVHLHVPGPDIFASDTHEDFMAALNGAVNKAKRQLKKMKDIQQDHHN